MKNKIKEYGGEILLLAVCAAFYLVTFWLYHLPLEAVLYPTGLCMLVVVVYFVMRMLRCRQKHREMVWLRGLPDDLTELLKKYRGESDRDYQAILEKLQEQSLRDRQETERRLADNLDYYTTWVHQIKTPIASMRLRLAGEDSPRARVLLEDLFRIEQYVEMVLTYQRLDSGSTDYVFRECSLDEIVKGALRKYAGQFIAKGIRLEYAGLTQSVLTDEKWLSFVLEQILSNALKYTEKGSITLWVTEPVTLHVRDTGMGIAPEDLPRIFEKGYTGYNGRADKRASGLGLYLCKRICGQLGVGIIAESVPGQGTTISLNLDLEHRWHE